MSYLASIINRIQYDTISFTNGGSDSPTKAITAVDVNKAVLIPLGVTVGIKGTQGSAAATEFCRFSLTDSTTVTATRSGDFNSQDATAGFVVVEFR